MPLYTQEKRSPMLELNDHEFERISKLIYDLCGIDLHEGKKELVKARLGKRLRSGNFNSFSEYYRFVTTEEGTDELVAMIDSISTNLTSFFREDKHFEKMKKICPVLLAGNTGPQKLTIWSAGCSTGEEPYSIAILVKEVLGSTSSFARILATDISTKVLKTAMAGIYTEDRVAKIPPQLLKKYFLKGQGKWEGFYRVKDDLKQMVKFMRLNLKEDLSVRDRFDVIFCRNVMIYFDKTMQKALIDKFYDCLKEGGYFFIGHSESLTGLAHNFKYIEPSVYQR